MYRDIFFTEFREDHYRFVATPLFVTRMQKNWTKTWLNKRKTWLHLSWFHDFDSIWSAGSWWWTVRWDSLPHSVSGRLSGGKKVGFIQFLTSMNMTQSVILNSTQRNKLHLLFFWFLLKSKDLSSIWCKCWPLPYLATSWEQTAGGAADGD